MYLALHKLTIRDALPADAALLANGGTMGL